MIIIGVAGTVGTVGVVTCIIKSLSIKKKPKMNLGSNKVKVNSSTKRNK